jgi:hypothetical protein
MGGLGESVTGCLLDTLTVAELVNAAAIRELARFVFPHGLADPGFFARLAAALAWAIVARVAFGRDNLAFAVLVFDSLTHGRVPVLW